MTTSHPGAYEVRPKTATQLLHEQIGYEAYLAWEALKAGEAHPRIITKSPEQRKRELRTQRYARDAAFYPKVPEILVTQWVVSDDYRDYLTPIYGPGGAVRQE